MAKSGRRGSLFSRSGADEMIRFRNWITRKLGNFTEVPARQILLRHLHPRVLRRIAVWSIMHSSGLGPLGLSAVSAGRLMVISDNPNLRAMLTLPSGRTPKELIELAVRE